MLTYLHAARLEKIEVVSYEDEAVGLMSRNEQGVLWVSSVVLTPRIEYRDNKRPSRDDEARLHHAAHRECFIANSVKTEVTVEPQT